MARYRLQEWLNFITSELHKGIGGLFNAEMPDAAKTLMRVKAASRLEWVDRQLDGRPYLMGDAFMVADAYLFTVTHWTKGVGIEIAGRPNLVAFQARMRARSGVQAALKAEGLMR